MVPPRGASYVWSIAAFGVVTALGLAAYLYDAHSRDMLAVLAQARPASLSAPRSGPAIYRGTVVGPADRRSVHGEPIAANWWRVVRRQSKSTTTVCTGQAQDRLVLRGDGVEVPISFVAENTQPFVIGETDENHWDRPVVVDLGPVPAIENRRVPTVFSVCARGERYIERRLERGASVEVYGCFTNGAIGPCPGIVAGVVSVGSLRDHRMHRAEDLRGDIRMTLLLSFVAMLVLSGQTLGFAARSMRVLTPRARSRP